MCQLLVSKLIKKEFGPGAIVQRATYTGERIIMKLLLCLILLNLNIFCY